MDDNQPITRKEFDELKELLEDTFDTVDENNKILRRMQHVGRVAFFAKAVMWTIVLVLPFFLLPLLSPYLRSMGIPGISTTSTSTSLFGYPSPSELQQAIQQYKSNL